MQIYFLDTDREKRENVKGAYVTVEQNEKENSIVERRKGKREKPTRENEKGTIANEDKGWKTNHCCSKS